MKRFILPLILLVFTLSSCDDSESDVELSGTYAGTFHYNYLSSSKPVPAAKPASISFSGKSYASVPQPDYYPAGGSGTYAVEGKVINFTDNKIYPAVIPMNMVLNGKYTYEVKGDSLFLRGNLMSETLEVQYRLKRVK